MAGLHPTGIASLALTALFLLSSSVHADERGLVPAGILTVLSTRCSHCHNSRVQRGGLDLSSVAGLLRGGESGAAVSSKDPVSGQLWQRLAAGDMPPEGEPPLSDAEQQLLLEWLRQGAPGLPVTESIAAPPDQHSVQPILLLRCKTCHGPQRLAGGVDLRSVTALLRGGPRGPLVIPGNPAGSPFLQRILSEACPPSAELLQSFVRRPDEVEVERLQAWVAAGCPQTADPIRPDPIRPDSIRPDSGAAVPAATAAPSSGDSQDPLVTAADREHWSFQPPQGDPRAGSIDDLIHQQLRTAGLDWSPEASREVLIRRATFDLLGLPPSLEVQQRWMASTDPNWFAQFIDELLASPHYGERWAVHWLDLAGYADSEGGVSNDPIREDAWKYRDYVIRAFNTDKPYNQFLLEQLAGDELIDTARAERVTPEMVDNLTATGFLRMGVDETGSRTMNFVPERLGVINDALTVVGSGLMGLTIECARCHSHKYDPIPQRDYYRLKAVFQGAFDEHDWLTFRNRTLRLETPERLAQIAATNPPLERRLKTLRTALQQAEQQLLLTYLQQHYPQQSESDNKATLQALDVADNIRSLVQRELVERLQRVQVLPDSAQTTAVLEARRSRQQLELEIHRLRQQLEPADTIRALWDRGDPSPTYLLRRGEHTQAAGPVDPGVPAVLTSSRTPFNPQPPFPGGTPKTGRRLAFARWLTDPQHPTTARVFVNRLWQHHFGAGLVVTVDNFGRQGTPPTHPQLLDWLALRFIDDGWSIKSLHRLMLNSRAWRQSGHVTPLHRERDPQNRLISRMPLRRLDAESLRDSLLAVSGRLNTDAGGLPDPVLVDTSGAAAVLARPDGNWRRSIYVLHRRTEMPTLLAAFDYPVMGPNCQVRSISSTALQPLLLANSGELRELAVSFAARVRQAVQDTGSNPVVTAGQLALGRCPTAEEQQAAEAALEQLTAAWSGDRQRALEVYCHILFSSAAFLYVD
ncbi:MAG: PSD1 and planctomycete cytochrome C domain-containing protein [Planctomycetota bacterium]